MKSIKISLVLILTFAFILDGNSQVTDTIEETAFIWVERMPVLADSSINFFEYLNLNTPYTGKEKLLHFIITFETSGEISKVEVKDHEDDLFVDNLKKVILNTSPWKPGFHDGHEVKVNAHYSAIIPGFIEPTFNYYLKLGDSFFNNQDFESANKYYKIPFYAVTTKENYNKFGVKFFNIGRNYLLLNDTLNSCIFFKVAKNEPYNNIKAKKYYRKHCEK